jgi:hypothetical protein
MAPITRSQCKISRLVDLNTLDAKFSNTTRPFLLRSSKRQRIKEEALKEYDIDHVEESRSATAAADAEPLTVPSPSPSKCEPIISSPGRKEKKNYYQSQYVFSFLAMHIQISSILKVKMPLKGATTMFSTQ